jgi:Zn-dependent oligopeptidase
MSLAKSKPVAPKLASLASKTKKSKKGLIIGLVAGGVGLIAIVVTVFLIAALSGSDVSRQAYHDAQKKADDAITALSAMPSLVITTYSSDITEAEIKNTADILSRNNEAFKKAIDELGDMKAIKNDKKAEELYQKITDKMDDYNEAMNVTIEAYNLVMPSLHQMLRIDYDYKSNLVDTVRTWEKAVDSIPELENDLNKDLASKLKDIVTRMQPAAKLYQACLDGCTDDDSMTGSVEYHSLNTEWSKAASGWMYSLARLEERAVINEEVNNLNEYLADKASGK